MNVVPAHVAVVGGGRWARVYLDVLDRMLPPEVSLSVHPRRGGDAIALWAAGRPARRVAIEQGAPAPCLGGVAIVANAAHDHGTAVRHLAQAGIPALVEKPLAPSWDESRRLAGLAATARLAPSQVFLFAGYIRNFAARVRRAGAVRSLSVVWSDPAGESRYGEVKRFDATVPVQCDVLPHVVTILELLAPGAVTLVEARGSRDGLLAQMDLRAGDIPCLVRLERQGEARRRLIEAVTDTGTLQLDFAEEPGVIHQGGATDNADQEWATGPRPLSRMLQAFFAFAAGAADERFDMALALRAAGLSDQVTQRLGFAQ